MAANGWWMVGTARESDAATRITQIRAIGTVLSRSAEVMLSSGDLSALRRIVADTSRTFHLDQCRIILGPDQVLADANPSKINQRVLPEHWNFGPLDAEAGTPADGTASMRYPVFVSGRGMAMLEIRDSTASSAWVLWKAQAGLGLIGAAALGMLLLAYRRNRSRLVAMEAIQNALLSFAEGEATVAALAVDPRYGVLAGVWNKLLTELDEFRRQASLNRVGLARPDRRTGANSLESACDTMSQGLILVNDRMLVGFANGAANVFLNLKGQELTGKPIWDLIADENIRSAVRGIAVDKSRKPVTLELERQGDSNGILRFSVRPIRKGDTHAATIIIEDIAQQRASERARNSFITQVTHELRTPLTNIRLYVESAIEEGGDDPVARATCLNIINRESSRLERIVGDMLSVAEIEAGSCSIHRDDVHLDVLFKELSIDYQAQAEDKRIKLELILPPKLPVLHADRDKLALAIHNLVGNALKYTPEGGTVTVAADVRDGAVNIDVTDTGIGISPDELNTIFDKFTRSKDPRVGKIIGTGLGLTFAREVMRLHGGDVQVQSELNRGSTFTATIPINAEAA
jgi:PAS domain S-box-containing protein